MMNIVQYLGASLSRLPLLFVASIGLLGTIYVFGTSMQEAGQVQSSEVNWNSNPFELEQGHKQDSSITINGVNEVARSLEFVINGYNPKANYELDFGDGTCQDIQQSRIQHVYHQAGNYVIELNATYFEETSLIEKNTLSIQQKAP